MKQKALSAAVADPLRSSPRDSPAVSLSGKASPICHPRDCPGGAQGRRPRTTPGRLPPRHGGLLSSSPFSLSSLLCVGRPQRNAVSAVTLSGVGVLAPPADAAWWWVWLCCRLSPAWPGFWFQHLPLGLRAPGVSLAGPVTPAFTLSLSRLSLCHPADGAGDTGGPALLLAPDLVFLSGSDCVTPLG